MATFSSRRLDKPEPQLGTATHLRLQVDPRGSAMIGLALFIGQFCFLSGGGGLGRVFLEPVFGPVESNKTLHSVSKSTSFLITGILIGILAAGGWFSWLGGKKSQSTPGVRVLKVAHSLPVSHPVHKGLEELKRLAEERSGGKLKLNIFPSEQLGTETQCLEKVQAGTLDITKVSAAAIGNFVPSYQVFSLPYLFRDEAHYWAVLEGAVGAQMLDVAKTRGDGSPSGLQGLGYFDSGSRSFYTVKPVASAEDLKGKKIRVMADQVAMDMVQAMGGSPTPISFGELYTALKQGTVDGAENNPPSFVSSRHYEICKYYVLDHHTRIPDVILASATLWNSLDAQEREWLGSAMKDAAKFQRELWKAETENSLALLRKEGVNIIEADPASFRAASASIVEKYTNETTRPLIDNIRAAN
jgi:tripartite ATP-independent transporter DctP family solute receptor